MAIKHALREFAKVLLIGVLIFVAGELGAALVGAVGLAPAPLAPGVTVGRLRLYTLVASPLSAVALALLAGKLRGGLAARGLSLAWLAWIVAGVNDQLEGLLVSTYTTSFWSAVLAALAPAVVGGFATAWLFPARAKAEPASFLASHSLAGWAWRLGAAGLAFAPIYFAFGLLVMPFVTTYYQQGLFGLREPALDQLALILLARSVLFLLACLPVLAAWSDTRRSLFWRLGGALFLLVGYSSIFMAYWLPLALRLPHAVEILADSLVYVWVVLGLLGPRRTGATPRPMAARKVPGPVLR